MLRITIFIFLAGFLSSCELITIGTKYQGPKVIQIDQTTPLGAVYLFKTELDSNNTMAAAQILASPEGNMYLAIDKYNMKYEIERLKRIIKNKPVTNIRIDTTTDKKLVYNIDFDYLETVTFKTRRINDDWFITDISGWKELTQKEVIINDLRY